MKWSTGSNFFIQNFFFNEIICIGIILPRQTWSFKFSMIFITLIFELFLAPHPNFDHSFPLTGFWTQKIWLFDEILLLLSLPSSINWLYFKSLHDNQLSTLTCLALQMAMSLNHYSPIAADPMQHLLETFGLQNTFCLPHQSLDAWKTDTI